MTRFARERQVYFFEEPVFEDIEPVLKIFICPKTNVHVVTPHIRPESNRNRVLQRLLTQLIETNRMFQPILWFYTPMALEFMPDEIQPSAIIYDCMDELSMFRGAPSELIALEEALFQKANLVFTGGVSLFEAKSHRHARIFPFPSGVDVHHFLQARNDAPDREEHRGMARPRLGYAGVIDERIDLDLIRDVAERRPDWQIVMIGPIAKIAPESLPQRPNIHWLGMKSYSDLPNYFSGWDVGIMPFALNDATKFISPTKTPEYLAAGLPVVSTPIRDVVRPYGDLGMVRIAASPDEFVAAVEKALAAGMSMKWRQRSDEFLKTLSWDSVWENMNRLLVAAMSPAKSLHVGGTVSRGGAMAVSLQETASQRTRMEETRV